MGAPEVDPRPKDPLPNVMLLQPQAAGTFDAVEGSERVQLRTFLAEAKKFAVDGNFRALHVLGTQAASLH